jgi:hypothetical protein
MYKGSWLVQFIIPAQMDFPTCYDAESVTLAIFLLRLELLLPPIGNLDQQPSLTNKKQGKVKSRFRVVPKQGGSCQC